MTKQQTVIEAINHLRRARNILRGVDAGRAADYTAQALKSAEGALRNADNLLTALQRLVWLHERRGTYPVEFEEACDKARAVIAKVKGHDDAII